ncbi:MAG: crotonobetainyl-CoA:carnitine CoA-transferase CaiB-like acyl-CoA transferase [Acidimicrobiales bacterium]
MTEIGPLANLRVLEVGGGIAAAVCARLLRGFGAETIRYELPDQYLTADEEVFLLAGSRRVRASSADLTSLVAGADIIIEDQRPGWLTAQGLDPLALRRARPELVITSISPFGQNGPQALWQTTNAVQFAVGGLMTLTGDAHREPLVTGGDQALFLGGLHAFAATVAVSFGQARQGCGDWIDISMQEGSASMQELYAAMSEYETQAPVVRSGNSVRSTWGVYRCADGFAGVCCLERQIPSLFALLGVDELTEPRFGDAVVRAEHDDEVLAHVMSFMLSHTKDELLELGPTHRVPFGAVRTPLELLDDDTYQARGFFDEVMVGESPVLMPGRPFPGLPWTSPERLHSPDEGDDGSDWEARPQREPDEVSPPKPPLDGIRVIDLTAFWAGPYATKLFAELGADVLKVESPGAWDNIRTLIPQDASIEDPWNSSYYFNEYSHSKRSLTLDLAQERGRELLLRFVATADVVIENYRADVLDNLGLDYEALRAVNEQIVLVSMAGFGKTGSLRSHVGFGPIIEMMSGLMSLTGYGDDDVPYKTGISYGDPVGGLYASAAVVLALKQRDHTGSGRHIDLAQRETASSMAGPAFVAASLRREQPQHWGNRHPHFVPQGCYPLAGDDEWLVVSVRSDHEWRMVCELIGRPDLADWTAEHRRAEHDALDDAIAAWTSQQSGAEAQQRLQDAGVPAGQVVDTWSIHDDPQLISRGFYRVLTNPKMRPYRQTGPTWRLTDTPEIEMKRAPFFGEHNDELLAELQISGAELLELAEANVIATSPINPSFG